MKCSLYSHESGPLEIVQARLFLGSKTNTFNFLLFSEEQATDPEDTYCLVFTRTQPCDLCKSPNLWCSHHLIGRLWDYMNELVFAKDLEQLLVHKKYYRIFFV